MSNNISIREKVAFFLFEGETEEIFYKFIFGKYLNNQIPRVYKNLETGTGINQEVAKHLAYFINCNPNTNVYTYVLLDREGYRTKLPEFNAKIIQKEVEKKLNTKQIGIISKIEAVQMIESWFFYDIEGICKYIGIHCSDSLRRNYANPESFNSIELSKLFRKGIKKRHYRKGDKDFIDKLDKEKIYTKCKDLYDGIKMINDDFI